MKHKYVVFPLMLSCAALCGFLLTFMGLPKAAPHSGKAPMLHAASSQRMPASLRGVTAPGSLATPRWVESYGRLPLSFEANQGQTDGQVKFLSRGRGYTMFLTQSEAVLSLRSGQSSAPRGISPQLPKTKDYGPRIADALFPPLIQNPKSQIQNLTNDSCGHISH